MEKNRFLPGSEDFKYEEFPFYWLARTSALYEAQLEKILKKLGADLPSRRVLLILQLHGIVSVSELATHSIIKLSTATRIVQRMRDEGLVETSTNEKDARITDVAMTEKGRVLLERIQQATRKIYARSYQNLSDDELIRLTATLKALFQNMAED